MAMKIMPGKPYPLGATWDGDGVNFALFSEHATAVDLCLFDAVDASNEHARIRLPEQTDHVWHVYLPDLKPGQLYGYRVEGPYDPPQGHRFNAAKLLIDPYTRSISGDIVWDDALYGYAIETQYPDADSAPDPRDSAGYMPKCVVIDPHFDWGDDRPPQIPLAETVIYETHVKGFTKLFPDLDEKLRGTYAGLASPPVIEYIKSLGITAIELLPVHQFADDRALRDRNLHNFWGYNTLGFFAPHAAYAATKELGGQVREFKDMVKALHEADIEVILDVVYNHTAEGNHLGSTLSLRGIDNRVYYRLQTDDLRNYVNVTGTGNSIDVSHPASLQMIMDSLRYWVTEMHVDGFRFDLATTLVRGRDGVSAFSSFLDTVRQDPVVSQVKLIAEAWDIGPNGYLVGKFPPGWSEWNDKYRDTVRRFWRGDECQFSEVAYRLTGSGDLYDSNGRSPLASINFVTAHDGFTLEDLVSYNQKRNEANGEGNRDGNDHNLSWNCGVEGPSDVPEIVMLREKQKRNFLATLLLSQGVPMLLAGDELGRTQQGNNNAYCQDNTISWVHWDLDKHDQDLLAFTRHLIAIRHEHPILRRRSFFRGQGNSGVADLTWYRPDGGALTDEEKRTSSMRTLGMLLNGSQRAELDPQGNPLHDDSFLLLLNGNYDVVTFKLPGSVGDEPWQVLLDTAQPTLERGRTIAGGESLDLQSRTLVLLRRP